MKWRELGMLLSVGAMVAAAPLVLAQSTFKPPTPFKAQRVEAFTAVSPDAALSAVPILPASAPGGALDLEWFPECDPMKPGTGVVNMRWKAGAALQSDQRVDVTKFAEGFATGKFQATRALPPALISVAMEKPEPGVSYYWRVLTRTPAGWVPSGTYRFDAPTCPVDSAVEPRS
jgi:hypothetical protein